MQKFFTGGYNANPMTESVVKFNALVARFEAAMQLELLGRSKEGVNCIRSCILNNIKE